jgi:DNA polymerase I
MALDRGVLIPGTKTQVEAYKPVRTLHDADRGGFIFQPDVGLHEDVHELDFSSLYPNIMIEHNISPETVLCDCHPEREPVPGLDYNICPKRGFLADVLEPIVTDRDDLKARIRDTEDAAERERLTARSEALKWILVTCFGYQGYKNSKFGRIEAHEAINAYARDILLEAKDIFAANGWEVIHGIVDSVWVTPKPGERQEPLAVVAGEISEQVRVPLEFEHEYDWVCFVPRRESTTGALTKYFGKISGVDEYKIRGIELRQHSTPPFVKEAQREYLDVLDEHREPEAVCDRFHRDVVALQEGRVPPEKLVIRKRVSKPLSAYSQATLTVSALQRYQRCGIEKSPGQPVRYVVVDDDARVAERVRLPFESVASVDTEFYETELLRACESIVSPLGWHREDINRYLRDETMMRLTAFSS